MEFCHTNPILRSSAIEQLCQFVQEWQKQWETSTPDFERFEHELHEKIMTVECEMLTEELARYDVDAEQIEVGGVIHRPTLTSSETYLSAWSDICTVLLGVGAGVSVPWNCERGSCAATGHRERRVRQLL
jgi:hypothetical protein